MDQPLAVLKDTYRVIDIRGILTRNPINVITEGNPFCNNINCRLYNAHWQEELIYSQIQSRRLCDEHAALLLQID